MIEVSPQEVIKMTVEHLNKTLEGLGEFTSSTQLGSILEEYITLTAGTDEETVTKARGTYHSLISTLGILRLFSDVYCTNSLTHSKSLNAVLSTFTGEDGQAGLILRLGALQRYIFCFRRGFKNFQTQLV
jgi:E3 ubiquitin-protein ligase HUWE1